MDKSTSKITRKFVIKFIIWSLLLTVVGIIGMLLLTAPAMENVDNEELGEAMEIINGLVLKIIVVDLIVAFLATILSIKGATKKIPVTSENKDKVVKNIIIVLIIFAVLVGLLHIGLKMAITNFVEDETDMNLNDLEEEMEEFEDKRGLTEYDEEVFEGLKGFMKMATVYSVDFVFILLMIPVAKKSIEKKVV